MSGNTYSWRSVEQVGDWLITTRPLATGGYITFVEVYPTPDGESTLRHWTSATVTEAKETHRDCANRARAGWYGEPLKAAAEAARPSTPHKGADQSSAAPTC